MTLARIVRVVGLLAALAGAVALPARQLGPLEPARIVPEQGRAFVANTAALGSLGPSDADGGSALRLLENGRPLSGHHGHDEIRRLGGGRFSHWGAQIYFSSTDNSDPRANGRSYVVVAPRSLLGWLVGESRAASWRRFALLFGATLLAASFAGSGSRLRTAAGAGACAAAAMLSLLSLPAALWTLAGLLVYFWARSGSTAARSAGGGIDLGRWGVALVAVAATAVAVLHVRALFASPVGWDEGILLAQTENLLQGQRLYADVMTQYPPGIYAVLLPALRVWHGLTAARAVAVLVHGGIALLAALLARRLTPDPLAPWTAAGLWLACATAFDADTLMSDPFSTLPGMAALLCLAVETGLPSRKRCLVAGALLAAGALCKQMGALWAVAAVVWLLLRPGAWGQRFPRIAAFFVGGLLVGLPVLVALAMRPRALFCTFVFPLSNRYAAETSLALLRDMLTPERWTIALALLVLAVLAWILRRPPEDGKPAEALLGLTALLSLLPLAKRSYAHYALPTLAALAVLAGVGAGRLRAYAVGRTRGAVALWTACGLGLVGLAGEAIAAKNSLDGLHTRRDDMRLVAGLRTLAPEGAAVVCTWPFAIFANRYRSPLRFHYDLAYTVPGELWLEEWRDLGRRVTPADLLIVRSRRNVYDMAAVLWKQIAPGEPLLATAEPPLLRPLLLPSVLWYAGREGQALQMALAGARDGNTVTLRGVTDAREIVFSGDWGETAHARVQPGEAFELRFAGPRDSWRLARAFAEGSRGVRWEGAEMAER